MKTIVFDLDGTLTESKEALDSEMIALLSKLLATHSIAIVSSSTWKQFQKQVLTGIDENVNNLYLLPNSGGSMYQTWGRYGWVATYQTKLSKRDTDRIEKAFDDAIADSGFKQPDKLWGKQFENRESQITFSALGQKAPIEEKESYDPDLSKRKVLVESLQKKLTSYDVSISGTTSVEVSLKGINKKFGIDELMKRLHVSKDDVLFVGSKIVKGNTNYVAVEMGLNYVQVNDCEDTKKLIRSLLDPATSLEKTG
jgi:HAD superfamily hydrolase (TIGR01484 family)